MRDQEVLDLLQLGLGHVQRILDPEASAPASIAVTGLSSIDASPL